VFCEEVQSVPYVPYNASQRRALCILAIEIVVFISLIVAGVVVSRSRHYLDEAEVKTVLSMIGIALGFTAAVSSDRWRVIRRDERLHH
jgi:cadmium resistance protein CadD (predicted permease)